MAAGALLAMVSGHAEARQWWILDFGQGYCHLVQHGLTPDGEVQWMRNSSEFRGPPTVNVIHSQYDGSVLGVTVVGTYHAGNQVQMVWATSQGPCQGALNYYAQKGQLVNRSELQ